MSGQRGLVLVAALVLVALIAAASATSLWLTRSELWAAGNARAWLQARYSAEAGAAHAIALLAPGTDFAALVARTGGLSDPTRPGPLSFGGGGFVAFPGPPFGYSVDPAAAAPPPAGGSVLAAERVVLVSTATSVRGAQRTVVATVGRAVDPYAPAALVAADDLVQLTGSGALSPAATSIDAAATPSEARAAIGVRSPAGATAAAALGLTLLGGAPTALIRPLDLAAYGASSGLAQGSATGQAVALGTDATPLALRFGAGEVANVAGSGIVLVAGSLTIRGDVALRGALFVDGTLTLAGPGCSIEGMVWARAIEIATPCSVRFDATAIASADRALRLPRRAVLLALTDR
jgi:hypothetical protein